MIKNEMKKGYKRIIRSSRRPVNGNEGGSYEKIMSSGDRLFRRTAARFPGRPLCSIHRLRRKAAWLPETKGESTGKRPGKKHAPGVKVNIYEPALQRPTLNFLFSGSQNIRCRFRTGSRIYETAVTFSGWIITACSACDPLW